MLLLSEKGSRSRKWPTLQNKTIRLPPPPSPPSLCLWHCQVSILTCSKYNGTQLHPEAFLIHLLLCLIVPLALSSFCSSGSRKITKSIPLSIPAVALGGLVMIWFVVCSFKQFFLCSRQLHGYVAHSLSVNIDSKQNKRIKWEAELLLYCNV